jgi:hypothetical protein
MNEEVESFAAMFAEPPGERQRAVRKVRAKAEKRTQLTEKQRRRNAVRTTQINFRCAPAFRERVAGLAKHLDCSIADVMDEALQMLAEAKGYRGAS